MPFLAKKILIWIFLLVALFSFSGLAKAQGTWNFASGSGLAVTAEKIGYSNNPSTPEMIIGRVITILLSLLGIVFLGLIIYGGLTWMTAAGNEQVVDRAQKIIEEAIVGLIIVIAAYAISYFVIDYLSKNNLA